MTRCHFLRVIETKEIGWTYQDRPVSNFFSPRMGNAQRLPMATH
jgi:hypothetical protein